MKVNTIVLNFRSALLAIVPVFDRVGIAWKRPTAYDEWDTIASTLFQTLVVDVFGWSLRGTTEEDLRMPRYDLLLSSYAGLCVLEVIHPSLSEGRWLFHAFGTASEPFDLVEVRRLSDDGRPLSTSFETCPVSDARFGLRMESSATLIEEFDAGIE